MKRIKKEVKEGMTFFRVSADDAVEIILFVMLLAAILGAVFKEKFVYLIFAAIIIFIWWETRKYKKEKMEMEKKLDKRISEFEKRKLKERKRKGR